MDYDAELRFHNDALRKAYGIRAPDRVLDIGCGTGQTTCDAARLTVAGSALGVDVSAPAIERARERAREEGVHNAAFEVADAQMHAFPPAYYDVAISRFGTMFFADPLAAFTNIARALRSRGHLVMMVWQNPERNEWSVAIERALAGDASPAPVPPTLDPFSLSDPTIVTRFLREAGFASPTFAEVDVPVYYGPDVAAALDWVGRFASTDAVLRRLEPASAELALERLRQTLRAHARQEGVWFGSRAWIVRADVRELTTSVYR
jgi:SAM-dependent methyltransferase